MTSTNNYKPPRRVDLTPPHSAPPIQPRPFPHRAPRPDHRRPPPTSTSCATPSRGRTALSTPTSPPTTASTPTRNPCPGPVPLSTPDGRGIYYARVAGRSTLRDCKDEFSTLLEWTERVDMPVELVRVVRGEGGERLRRVRCRCGGSGDGGEGDGFDWRERRAGGEGNGGIWSETGLLLLRLHVEAFGMLRAWFTFCLVPRNAVF